MTMTCACAGEQVILSQLLQHWGDAGLEAHVRKTQQEYWRRASALHEAATQVWIERLRSAEAGVKCQFSQTPGSGSACISVKV